jgi:hypothetical protein
MSLPCVTTVHGEDTLKRRHVVLWSWLHTRISLSPGRRMNGGSAEARGRAIEANRVEVGGVLSATTQ